MYNVEFIKEAISFLQEIEDNTDKQAWCSDYSVYEKSVGDVWNLENELYYFCHRLYDEGYVPTNYGETCETLQDLDLYRRKPTPSEIMELSPDQLVACIAKQVRNDHFDNGVLIHKYIAEGILLSFFKALDGKCNES